MDNGKPNILIIDDDDGVRQVLKDYCEAWKCFNYVVTAKNGVIALQKLKQQSFEIILLDLDMPVKDGMGVLETLDPSQKNKVVIVSGSLSVIKFADLIKYGVNKVLVKPFNEEQVREKIIELLKRKVFDLEFSL